MPDPGDFEVLIRTSGTPATVPDVGGYQVLVHVNGSGLEVPADGNYEVVVVNLGPCDCCGGCVFSDCVSQCEECDPTYSTIPCDLTFTIASPDCSILNFTELLRDADPLARNWQEVSPPPAPVTGGPGVICEPIGSGTWSGPGAISWSCPNFGGAQVNLDSSIPTVISCCPLHLQWTGGVVTTSGDPDCACIGAGPPNTISVTIDVTAPTLNWCLKVCAGDGSCVYVCSDDCTYTHVGQVVFSGGVTTTVVNGPFWETPCDPNCPCLSPPMAPAPTRSEVEAAFAKRASSYMPKLLGSRSSTPAKPLRLIRCEHLGRRTELRQGCNGWLCKHDCGLGLTAIPGATCQVCPEYRQWYEPEPGEEVRNDWLD